MTGLEQSITVPESPPPPGWPARWRSSPPAARRPLLIQYVKKERKKERKKVSDKLVSIEYKEKMKDEIKESSQALIPPPIARRLSFLHLLPAGSSFSIHSRQELPHASGRQEVRRRLVTVLYGEQLRYFHTSASTRSRSRHFSHLFPERCLLVFPSAAVVEEMLPRVGNHPASATAPPAFVVVSVSEPFQVRPHWRMSGLQSIEPGC